ncbi:uncharacterized protein DS421_13g418110 [Arachis hypogaea]|nr:uncharacterized protein DS421_13g418110 [Arachis hypogaea]
MYVQEELGEKGGVYSCTSSCKQQTNWRGCSFRFVGLEEIRSETYQRFTLSKGVL